MIAGAVKKNLSLVLESAKGPRMNDARAITLKLGPISMGRLGKSPPARIARFLCERRERSRFVRLHLRAGLVLAHSPLSFSRRIFRAPRPCIFRVSRSKTARSSARKVSQAQVTQKKINQPGCSRGDRNGCKNVVPAKSRTIAKMRTTNMVQRRVD